MRQADEWKGSISYPAYPFIGKIMEEYASEKLKLQEQEFQEKIWEQWSKSNLIL
jgi:hypothetical protein